RLRAREILLFPSSGLTQPDQHSGACSGRGKDVAPEPVKQPYLQEIVRRVRPRMPGVSERQVFRAVGRRSATETLGCPKLEVGRKRCDRARIMEPGGAVADILTKLWRSQEEMFGRVRILATGQNLF